MQNFLWLGEGSLRVYKIAFTSWPYTSTGESSCKARESAHPNTPSFQTRNAGPHFLNLTGYFINAKLSILLTLRMGVDLSSKAAS